MRKSVALLVVVAAGIAVFLWGNRCAQQPLPHGHKAKICHRLFRPSIMLVYDEGGRPFEYTILENSRWFQPRESYLDLFGSGRISEFVTNRHSTGDKDGLTQTIQVSTADDERVDLVFEFVGEAHPLAGRLSRAIRIDKSRCSSWELSKKKVAGRWISKSSCTDPSAAAAIAAGDAVALVEAMPILREREGFILGRVRSQGDRVSLDLLSSREVVGLALKRRGSDLLS
jgi:hypothetical protein